MNTLLKSRNALVIPAVFLLIVAVVAGVIVIASQSDANAADCPQNAAAQPAAVAPHSHGSGIASVVKDDVQLIFNVSPAAELYQVVDGELQACSGDLTGEAGAAMKHITLDVNDARLLLGERLPVDVHLTVSRSDTGEVVLDALAPAMVAVGHGYHYGDNFLVPNGATYTWDVEVSPVKALRQSGAQGVWLEPVRWQGEFTLEADGTVTGKGASPQVVGDFTQAGLHVTLSRQDAVQLYDVTGSGSSESEDLPEGSTYFVVDVTDHAVNLEEKIVGVTVTLTFTQGDETFTVDAPAVISPTYGFHYGANVAVGPGEWQVEVTVSDFDFLRHAGAAISLPRNAVTGTFTLLDESQSAAG